MDMTQAETELRRELGRAEARCESWREVLRLEREHAAARLTAMTERVKESEVLNAGLRHANSVLTRNWDRLRDQQQATITAQQQEIERLKVDVKQEGYLMGIERSAEIANRLGAYEARNAILFQKEPSHEKTD